MGMTGDAAYALSKKYTEDTVIGMGAIKGDKGDKGDTGAQGVQGVQGPKGDAATISVGTVTTGTTSSVTNSGTTSSAVFDFVLEKGETGDKGDNAQIFTGTDIATDGIYNIATSHIGDIYINVDTSSVYQRTDDLGTLNYWKEVCSIKGNQGDDAYQVAVSEGFIGTKSEWLASLTGEAKGSEIVWEKPDIHGDTIDLGKWYYYKVDSDDYGVGSAWLNRFDVPKNKDYVNGKYAFYDGIKYLCFASNTPIPALTNKDTHDYYVLYDEKNSRCQGHMVELSTGTDTSLDWYEVTKSLIIPNGYEEVTARECTQYGKWTQTIYLGSSKENAYDCTMSTGTSVSGFISTEAFAQTIGSLGDLTTTNKTNIVSSINEVNSRFDKYVAKTDVIDGLTSTSENKPLSANQGKVLNESIEAHTSNSDIHVTTEDKTNWNDKIDKTSISKSISSSSTDEQVPSAKTIYNILNAKLSKAQKTATDLNDVLTPGYYQLTGSDTANNVYTNCWGIMHVITNDALSTESWLWIWQIVYDNTKNKIYYRRKINTNPWGEWTSICTTKLADVPLTNLASENTGLEFTNADSSFQYYVKNGICYVNVWSLKSTVAGSEIVLTTKIPVPAIRQVHPIHTNVMPYSIVGQLHTVGSSIKINIPAVFERGYCSFSYPVQES